MVGVGLRLREEWLHGRFKVQLEAHVSMALVFSMLGGVVNQVPVIQTLSDIT